MKRKSGTIKEIIRRDIDLPVGISEQILCIKIAIYISQNYRTS